MARVTSPLFGFDAAGQIGKSIVFGNWKGVRYARQRVDPANPRTVEQTKTRRVFSFLGQLDRALTGYAKEPWQLFSAGRPLTARNALFKFNISLLRNATDITSIVTSPSTRSAPALSSINVESTANAGELRVSVGVPQLPPGWSLERAVYVVLRQQDPHDPLAAQPVVATTLTPATPLTISGLQPGTTYVVSAFARYVTPDGGIAHSASINATGTTA